MRKFLFYIKQIIDKISFKVLFIILLIIIIGFYLLNSLTNKLNPTTIVVETLSKIPEITEAEKNDFTVTVPQKITKETDFISILPIVSSYYRIEYIDKKLSVISDNLSMNNLKTIVISHLQDKVDYKKFSVDFKDKNNTISNTWEIIIEKPVIRLPEEDFDDLSIYGY